MTSPKDQDVAALVASASDYADNLKHQADWISGSVNGTTPPASRLDLGDVDHEELVAASLHMRKLATVLSTLAAERDAEVRRVREEARANYILAHARAAERDQECFRLQEDLESALALIASLNENAHALRGIVAPLRAQKEASEARATALETERDEALDFIGRHFKIKEANDDGQR